MLAVKFWKQIANKWSSKLNNFVMPKATENCQLSYCFCQTVGKISLRPCRNNRFTACRVKVNAWNEGMKRSLKTAANMITHEDPRKPQAIYVLESSWIVFTWYEMCMKLQATECAWHRIIQDYERACKIKPFQALLKLCEGLKIHCAHEHKNSQTFRYNKFRLD